LHVVPHANFDNQRSLIALRTDPPIRVRSAMTRMVPFFRRRVAHRPFTAGGTMKMKDQTSERSYQGRRDNLRKSAFNTQLQPLRLLETATKKRRALKKKAAKNSEFTKSGTTASG
jgi:hypothetical protein